MSDTVAKANTLLVMARALCFFRAFRGFRALRVPESTRVQGSIWRFHVDFGG